MVADVEDSPHAENYVQPDSLVDVRQEACRGAQLGQERNSVPQTAKVEGPASVVPVVGSPGGPPGGVVCRVRAALGTPVELTEEGHCRIDKRDG